MGKGWQTSSGAAQRGLGRWAMLVLPLALLAAGCGSVALRVEQPAGARVELCEKAKWFGSFGPDWGTRWNKVSSRIVGPTESCVLQLDADNSWLESAVTLFPRQYRACFDLSRMQTYPKTPTTVVEVRYYRDAVRTEHQEVVRLWHEGRTLDALIRLPAGVLADVLYNLGSHFTRLLDELTPAVRTRAATDFATLLQAARGGTPPTPVQIESWLKSFLDAEQLGQLLQWVREGVTLRDVRWVRLGGEPRDRDVPLFWALLKGSIDLFVRQPEIRTTEVNFYEDVILRHLLVRTLRTRLVDLSQLQVYAEIIPYDTTHFSERTTPAIDLVQNTAMAKIQRPTAEQQAELEKMGMTRSVQLDRKDRADVVRTGLPPVGANPLTVTSVHSQVLGALLEGEMAYLVIWNNPRRADPIRFLTTVVTPGPYGMARVWTLRGNEQVCEAYAAFDRDDAPLGLLASWVVSVFDQRSLFVRLDKPLAVMALGRRPIAPWSDRPRPPASRATTVRELEPPK